MILNGGTNEFDIIIIGGGVIGAGTARDCSLHGMRVLPVERFNFAAGVTGRNHGLLHSGVRHAVTDRESTAECIKENMILRKIARHCVEENGGLFIFLPEDDPSYQNLFVESYRAAGINTETIDPAEARLIEPSVNPSIIGAVKVPDGSIDPFRLILANVVDVRAHGAKALVYHEVTTLVREQGAIVGVTVFNHKTKTEHSYYVPLTINTGGIWGHGIAAKAGIRVDMFPAKGSLLIFGHRINDVVLNRCHKPANADILIPGDTICLIGTVSSRVGFDEVDDVRVTSEEADLLLSEGEKLAPALTTTRILRAYVGIRPLVAADNDPSGRNISHGIVLLDHETCDGVAGFVTITGGRLMTYRLMAEWATDLACKRLGVDKPCATMNEPLPGSRMGEGESSGRQVVADQPRRSSVGCHGEVAVETASESKHDNSPVCECEDVTVGGVNYAVNKFGVYSLIDLRCRTRVGTGTCQGELCACRAAGLLGETYNCSQKAKDDLASSLNEHWKGLYPVAWGEALRESEYTQWIYSGVCGME